MRIALAGLGTWGDIQPFVHLAATLREAGHAIRILGGAEHRSAVQDAVALDYVAIASDLPADLMTRLQGRVVEDRNPAGQIVTICRWLMIHGGRRQYRRSLAALADCELLVAHATALHSQQAARRLGIPVLGVALCPAVVPDGADAPMGLPDLGVRANRAAWIATGMVTEAVLMPRLRRAVRRAGGPRPDLDGHQLYGSHGVLVGASPLLTAARPPRGCLLTGHWHRPPPADARLPEPLARFLDAGEPPVFIGFGSMAPGDAEAVSQLCVGACRDLGRRLVLQRGWAGLHADGEDVCVVDHLPHDLLLPRCAALVHHCGAGTSHAAARAGVPSVPVPHLVDQPWWARRLRDRQAATAAIPRRQLSRERLRTRLAEALASPRLRAGAQQLAERMRQEDGCAVAVAAINRIGSRHRRSSPATPPGPCPASG